MRFVTYADNEGHRVGVVEGETICPLMPGIRLIDLLGDPEQLRAAGESALRAPRAARVLHDVQLRAPIPRPPTVRDFMTFEQHLVGTTKLRGADAQIPEQWYAAPAFYFTNPYAVHGPNDDVSIPPGCSMFDFELEAAAVIGRPGRDISVADAETHIAGYLMMNDWSARDLQFAEMQVGLGPAKGKDSANSLGPVLVTSDELAPYRSENSFALQMTAKVNDVVVAEDMWSNMAFSYAQMIAYASRGTEVRTGDVLSSGTCGGGCLAELWGRNGFDAHSPLSHGDVVTLTVEHLGTQSSRVVSADPRSGDDLTATSKPGSNR